METNETNVLSKEKQILQEALTKVLEQYQSGEFLEEAKKSTEKEERKKYFNSPEWRFLLYLAAMMLLIYGSCLFFFDGLFAPNPEMAHTACNELLDKLNARQFCAGCLVMVPAGYIILCKKDCWILQKESRYSFNRFQTLLKRGLFTLAFGMIIYWAFRLMLCYEGVVQPLGRMIQYFIGYLLITLMNLYIAVLGIIILRFSRIPIFPKW